MWERENVFSQSQQFPSPQTPPSFIPRIRRADPTSTPPHPIHSRGPIPTSAGDFTGPGFVRLHTAQPSSLPLLTPPSPLPPQGPPSPTRLTPLCLPICLHLKMSPGPLPASLCSTFKTQREAFMLPNASHLPWRRTQENGPCCWSPCPSLGQQLPPPIRKLLFHLRPSSFTM